MKMRTTATFATLLLFGAAGCADLDVTNPNQPDRGEVVTGAEDLEELIAGSYQSWWEGLRSNNSLWHQLSNASFESAATAANFGMVDMSAIPRTALNNTPAYAYAEQFEWTWGRLYRAIAGTSDGIRGLEDQSIPEGRGLSSEVRTQRAIAFGKFVQGLAHGMLALTYDEAFVADETLVYDETALPAEQEGLELQPYMEVFEAAIGYFDDAIAIAEQNDFTLSGDVWINGLDLTNQDLIQLANSYKARFRAQVARTPEERANVDWNQVMEDIENGIQADFMPVMESGRITSLTTHYANIFTDAWGRAPYFIYGMADQTGRYQEWMSTPVSSRTQFVMETPDQRFPQGSTLGEQEENPGSMFVANSFESNPGRGTWRWSHYDQIWEFGPFQTGAKPEITMREMALLRAEALFREGDEAGAADIINETRVGQGGLSPTDAAGTNDDCVPRLPNGECGDLLEMLKWEKRINVYHTHFGAWFFDSRGWGDLMEGTYLHYAMPAQEVLSFLMEPNTHGGGEGMSAGTSTYGY